MENKESFFDRVSPHLAPSEICKIRLAYYLAKHGHRAQVRKELVDNKPQRYFEHVRRVALVLMDEAECMDSNMICAALLHDILEDCGEDMTPEILESAFGADVVSIVKKLSKIPKEGYLERLERCADWRVLMIKFCDKLDNLRSLNVEGVTEEFRARQFEETSKKFVPKLMYRFLNMVPSAHEYAAKQVLSKINRLIDAHYS